MLIGKLYKVCTKVKDLFWAQLLLLILAPHAVGAPTDGIVHWSSSDKRPEIQLDASSLNVTSTASQWVTVGVRGNRPIHPGEGFYYFEINHLQYSQFTAGVATSEASLTELAGWDGYAAVYNQDGRTIYNGQITSAIANPVPTVGVAVDYRGSYPIVHFIGAE